MPTLRKKKLLAWLALLPLVAAGAGPAAGAVAISFDESSQQIAARSDAVAGAAATAAAARDQSDALKVLRLPQLSLNAQGLRYQKTVRASLGELRSQAEASASDVLDGIAANGIPGLPDSAVDQVMAEVQDAVPDLFAGIPDSVSLRARRSLFRASLTAVAPLYTGGTIAATQATARAGVQAAEAGLNGTQAEAQFALVQAYFGQVLAEQLERVARDTRDGFQAHLENARKLEQYGQLSHARVLQITVARDSAQRALEAAEGEARSAAQALAHLLRSDTQLAPSTPLFVNSRPLPDVAEFVAAAQSQQPRLQQAQAAAEAAQQAVKLAQASRRPTVVAFGSYNLNRSHALLAEPDWLVGVGLRYTLWPQAGGRKAQSAAQARQSAAEAASREAWVQVQTAVHKAHNLTETARRQYLSLDSSIAAAAESQRVTELSFREGVATATELIDARNLLAQAHTERATVAYKYDLALASLLLASGQMAAFSDHLHRADLIASVP